VIARVRPVIEVEYPAPLEVEPEESTELEMTDLEEIPLPEPRVLGVAAALALSKTPLFAGLPREALESLVQQLQLVHLGGGEILFKEGDPGDALYVIVEGEVSVQAEGPPRVEMARLGPGSFIGEVALMTDQPRSATISGTTDTELLRIDRKTLASVLSAHGEVLQALLRFVRDRLVDRWMRTSPLLRPFPEGERAHLVNRFSFLEIDPGAKLLSAGAKPDGLYIVLAGNFAVRRAGKDIVTLGPGDLIGETALLSGGAFRSDVIAKGKALALCLPAADFREMIMTHPHVLEYIGEAAEHSRKLQIL
jgi:CRP-like cAMP-binding protein